MTNIRYATCVGKYFLSEEDWESGGLGDGMGLPLHLEELRLTIGLVVIILFIISHENLEKKVVGGRQKKH